MWQELPLLLSQDGFAPQLSEGVGRKVINSVAVFIVTAPSRRFYATLVRECW